jgi:hypothetical protein
VLIGYPTAPSSFLDNLPGVLVQYGHIVIYCMRRLLYSHPCSAVLATRTLIRTNVGACRKPFSVGRESAFTPHSWRNDHCCTSTLPFDEGPGQQAPRKPNRLCKSRSRNRYNEPLFQQTFEHQVPARSKEVKGPQASSEIELDRSSYYLSANIVSYS